jgi:hypothetical protein
MILSQSPRLLGFVRRRGRDRLRGPGNRLGRRRNNRWYWEWSSFGRPPRPFTSDYGRGAGRIKMCRHSPTDRDSPLARHAGHNSGVPGLGSRGVRTGQALERGRRMSRIGQI